MKAHLIENGVVVNTIVVDTLDVFPNLIDAEFGGNIGDLWDGSAFTAPPPMPDSDRISKLWQAAHDYEYAQISGSAIGLLTMGAMQAKPKCLAVRAWIDAIWAEYYSRKSSGSDNFDFSSVGPCPYTVPELSAELSA